MASQVVDGDIAEVARLTLDNQRQRLVDLRPLVARQKSYLASVIDLRRREGLEAAAKVVATGNGKRTMDTIRRHIDEMIIRRPQRPNKRARRTSRSRPRSRCR
ncbi:CHASE3 domain-containing protein [Polyangium jinanense]|uniref:CHASE3 domain-containing protein n=1 Tax=Polyangium jinanense TaxID=2829994 RepID=A0A9X3X312_9BACT|nr:CHASE3 domain-containing protein [Polyangium jinanense]MDC3981358.1 CHASE3 domain-containing protein [Polyangium jinanense]